MTRLRLTALAALALVLALPATVSAAVVDVTGTVAAADGTTPTANVEVAIRVRGNDEIFAATTDENGAWGLQLDLLPGDVLEVAATGPTVRSDPDEDGCITSTTPTARLVVTVGEAGPEPLAILLDGEISGKVCAATATPQFTPPATDARAGSSDAGNGAMVIAAGLGLLSAALFVAATPRRSRRIAVRARR